MDAEIRIEEPETNRIDDPESNIQEPETSKIIKVKVAPIIELLKVGATSMGMVTCWWAMMLIQGGIFFTTVETKDCLFIMVIVLFISFSLGIHFCPDRTWHGHYSTNSSMWVNIKHLELPISFINGVSYCFKLVSAIICAVLSMMRLVSQDFGRSTKGENNQNMATRNFALNAFYVSALIETLLSLLDLVLQKLFEPPKRDEKKTEIMNYMYSYYSQQQDQSNNSQAKRRKGPSVDPAEKCKKIEMKYKLKRAEKKPNMEEYGPVRRFSVPVGKKTFTLNSWKKPHTHSTVSVQIGPEPIPVPVPKAEPNRANSQQQDQSNNSQAKRRKGPSVDPAETCKQTEEKKLEMKKSK